MEAVFRRMTQLTALCCGASGIFFLWASFTVPHSAMDAIVLLAMATGLILAIPGKR